MIYRKPVARPARLLLRIVATAGAAAVGIACSGEVLDQHSDPACNEGICGSIAAVPQDAGVGGGFTCGDAGLCGTIAVPEDAGDDASSAVGLVCGGDAGLCGSIAVPDDAGDEDAAMGGGMVGVAPNTPTGG